MSKYGKAAIKATELYSIGSESSPSDAWKSAVKEIFPDSQSSQDKGCPKGAYLGLCEDGVVVGIPRGKYSRSEKNKNYAVIAIKLLRDNPSLSDDPKVLWTKVMQSLREEGKKPNSQMEVVIALWSASLISGA